MWPFKRKPKPFSEDDILTIIRRIKLTPEGMIIEGELYPYESDNQREDH